MHNPYYIDQPLSAYEGFQEFQHKNEKRDSVPISNSKYFKASKYFHLKNMLSLIWLTALTKSIPTEVPRIAPCQMRGL